MEKRYEKKSILFILKLNFMTKTQIRKKHRNFIKLCYEYPDLSYGFYWLLKVPSGYRLDARIAKAAKKKIIDQMYPNFLSLW